MPGDAKILDDDGVSGGCDTTNAQSGTVHSAELVNKEQCASRAGTQRGSLRERVVVVVVVMSLMNEKKRKRGRRGGRGEKNAT